MLGKKTNNNLNSKPEILEELGEKKINEIKLAINHNRKSLLIRLVLLSTIFILMFFCIYIIKFTPILVNIVGIQNIQLVYVIVNISFLILSIFISIKIFINGISSIFKLKPNLDSSVSFIVLFCLFQSIMSYFYIDRLLVNNGVYLYSILAILALLLNILGKFYQLLRVKSNFNFCISNNELCSIDVDKNIDIPQELLNKTKMNKFIVAHKFNVQNITNFFKNSYAQDYCELLFCNFPLINLLISLALTITYYLFIEKDIFSSIGFFISIMIVLIPINSTLVYNLPLYKCCKKILKKGIAIINCFGVKKYSNVNVIEINDSDIFSTNDIKLCGIKSFHKANLDDILLYVTAINSKFDGLLPRLFRNIIQENRNIIPNIHNVTYKAGRGITAYINNKKIIFGNKNFINDYNIKIDNSIDEHKYNKKGTKLNYLAINGTVVAVFIIIYNIKPYIKKAMKKLKNLGIKTILHTNDININETSILEDLEMTKNSITLIYDDNVTDYTKNNDKSNNDLIYIKNNLYSFASFISNSVKLELNMSFSFALQIISIILGIISVILISFFSSMPTHISEFKLLAYLSFWTISIFFISILLRSK